MKRLEQLLAPSENNELPEIQRALSRLEADSGDALPLRQLASRFKLSEAECDVLLLAVAPALSSRWRALVEQRSRYGKLDVAFAIALLEGQGLDSLSALSLFESTATLRRHALIEVFALGRADQSQLLSHRLQAPSRVSHVLRGTQAIDEALLSLATLHCPDARTQQLVLPEEAQGLFSRVENWLHRERTHPHRAMVAHIRGPSGVGKTTVARTLGARVSMPTLEVDCSLLQTHDPTSGTAAVRDLLHTAELFRAILVLDGIDALARGGAPLSALRSGIEQVPVPILLLGTDELPEASGLGWRSLACLRLSLPEPDEREAIWKSVLLDLDVEDDVEPGVLANQFPLTTAQIANARDDALLARESSSAPLSHERLEGSSSEQLRADLTDFAQPRSTRLTLDDLVLPPKEMDSIREVITACRQRASVVHRWGFRKRLDYGTGIVALFSGEPGTGKTLSARIIAEAIGMSLYQIAIPSIVSKWIGETERNISQIFHRAKASQAILLFDEADSLLATRTEVRDSTDRYANMSTNQLLQEIEAFEGIVILTTNREQNLDAAAERRILFRITFPYPDVDERRRLWELLLPKEACSEETPIDFESLGELYELSGGHIKNVIMRAAFTAMDRGGPIDTDILGEAAERECRAIGKLVRQGW